MRDQVIVGQIGSLFRRASFFAIVLAAAGCGYSESRESEAIEMVSCTTIELAGSQRGLILELMDKFESEFGGKYLAEPQMVYYKSNSGELYIHFADTTRAYPNQVTVFRRSPDFSVEEIAMAARLNKEALELSDCSESYQATITPYDF